MALNNAKNVCIGSDEVQKVYLGSSLIWQRFVEALSVEPSTLFLDYKAGSASFDVIGNAQWNVIANSINILSYEPEYGEGDGSVDFSYRMNSGASQRTFQIGVASANSINEVAMVNVIQACAEISLSSYERTFDYLAHLAYVYVYDTDDWSAECDEDWITITKDSTGAYLRFYDNPVSEDRTATIRFYVNGTDVSTYYELTQEARPARISVEPSAIFLDHEGGSISFIVNSSANWRVQRGVPQPFLISPSTGGPGETEVTATIRPNTGDTDITHNLHLETTDGAANAIFSVIVRTGVAVITLDRGISRVHRLNPTDSMYVESTLPWSISSDNPNITFNYYSGDANEEYAVTMTYRGAIGTSGTANVTVVSGTVSETITVRYGGL